MSEIMTMTGQHTLGLGSAQSGARRVQSVIDPYVIYRADSTRSIPRLVLETTAMAAMVILLLYVLFGPPT